MWATVKAHNPPVRLMRTNLVAADTQNKLHRRPANNNVDCSNIKNITHQGTPPRDHVPQGAGTGTNHDPNHGGIT